MLLLLLMMKLGIVKNKMEFYDLLVIVLLKVCLKRNSHYALMMNYGVREYKLK